MIKTANFEEKYRLCRRGKFNGLQGIRGQKLIYFNYTLKNHEIFFANKQCNRV